MKERKKLLQKTRTLQESKSSYHEFYGKESVGTVDFW